MTVMIMTVMVSAGTTETAVPQVVVVVVAVVVGETSDFPGWLLAAVVLSSMVLV